MLTNLFKNIEMEDVEKNLVKKQNSKVKPMMLISTVNCSIGNKEKHFTFTGLKIYN